MRRDHLLVRAEHALRVDHALGHAGRAGGEEESSRSCRPRCAHGRLRLRASARPPRDRRRRWPCGPCGRRLADHDLGVGRHARRDGAREASRLAPRRRGRASASRRCGAACRNRTTSANRRPRSARKGCRHAWRRAQAAHARCHCRRGSRPGARAKGRARRRAAPMRRTSAMRLAVRDTPPIARVAALREEETVGRRAAPNARGARSGARDKDRAERANAHRSCRRRACREHPGFAEPHRPHQSWHWPHRS